MLAFVISPTPCLKIFGDYGLPTVINRDVLNPYVLAVSAPPLQRFHLGCKRSTAFVEHGRCVVSL
jgi:hypothetical protein